jgi:hypothetical protein
VSMVRATALIVALLACGAAAVVPATPAQAAKPCWKQLIDDWTQDQVVDGRYSARCIEEALGKVPEDIRAYSDFEEQAQAALIQNSRELESTGGGSAPSGTGGGDGGGSGAAADDMVQPREPDTGPKDETPVDWALGTNGNNADSVPVPLLVLLGLALALITAGGAGFAARKIRARRPGA